MKENLLTQIELIFAENLDCVKFLVQRWLKIRNAQELLEIEREIHDYFRKFADSIVMALIIAVIGNMEYQQKTLDMYRSWPNPMRSAGRRNVKVNLLGGSSFTIRTPYFVPDRRGQRGRPRGIGRRGNIENLLEAFSPLLKGRNSKKIRTEYNYFSNNREMMRYLKFEKMGLPIGSGAIESAIRRIVNLRMKGNGIFWLEESAEGMLHLRSYIKSGRWDELVKRTIYFQVDNKVNIPKVRLKKAA